MPDVIVTPIMDSLFEMAIYYNDNGIVVHANDMAQSMLEYEDLNGKLIGDVFPGVFNVENGKVVTDAPIDGSVFDIIAYRENHTCFKVKARIVPSNMMTNCYVVLAVDTSKTDALEKEIVNVKENSADLTKVKNEFVANVTHELRTPVNGILGNTRELLTHNPNEEDARILRMIERGCEDMNALINNILDFSKLDAGKFQLEPREFNFRDMIEYVKSNHINKIHEKGLDFFLTISPDIPDVLIGDELRIAQILNNLLSNATKFTTVGKVMMEAVATAKMGNRMELFFMVVDSGIGIDKKDQDKLFKSFSQVEASISRRFGGTGLGLNISKQLVELMGGHISVDSELGKGTTFTFSIWLDIPSSEADAAGDYTTESPVFSSQADMNIEESMSRSFGSSENLDEIEKRLMKLTLCIDMDNWEKAEMYTDAIKQLTDGAPHETKTAVLKLKMAVAKENSEKSSEAIQGLRASLSGGKE